MDMKIFLIILGIYIGMVILSLLGPYIDFRQNYCEKGRVYTLEDLYNSIDNGYWMICFIPLFNAATIVLTLIWVLVIPLWEKIKGTRIV